MPTHEEDLPKLIEIAYGVEERMSSGSWHLVQGRPNHRTWKEALDKIELYYAEDDSAKTPRGTFRVVRHTTYKEIL